MPWPTPTLWQNSQEPKNNIASVASNGNTSNDNNSETTEHEFIAEVENSDSDDDFNYNNNKFGLLAIKNHVVKDEELPDEIETTTSLSDSTSSIQTIKLIEEFPSLANDIRVHSSCSLQLETVEEKQAKYKYIETLLSNAYEILNTTKINKLYWKYWIKSQTIDEYLSKYI